MAGVSPVVMAGMGAGLAGGVSSIKPSATTGSPGYQNRVDEINAQIAEDERKRKAAYDRTSARQRALFAAQGILPTDGSSAAVLNGLKTMSEAEANDHARQMAIAKDRIAMSYSSAIGENLLTKKSALFQDNLDKLMGWD